MIDFSGVLEVSIPEGIAVKILSGERVLWERPGLLPSAYQQVEYIATDGNQYIDTGVLASDYSDGIRYTMKGNVISYQSTSTIYWFGALADGSRSGNVCTSGGALLLIAGSSGSGLCSTTYPDTGVDFELVAEGSSSDVSNFYMTLDGNKRMNTSATTDSEMPETNIYLFTAKGTSAATTANRKYYGKLYSFAMDSVDGTPIRNFVPCCRKSDDVIGLYDTVEGVFYTNIGTGSFTSGADAA